ncbi:MAG: amidohydrolase family protein [Acidimicrobiales bacterium]|nr:amidohydrolase family protein [Acidimicrobiales bacterium]MCB9393604.1 amidohydrolase family protein [Acidimicrobiaceae bacterium]
MSEHDLVIRNATVVDGTGAAASVADVAVSGDRITAVGRVDGRGHREIDADGLTVTPGFVDVHTHFDGQATWDPVLAPSSIHGVTSIVMGNCGVGFAPARPTPEHHDWLIAMLEGVEDIPGTALAEGLTWDWETFTDYLDALDRRRYALDVATHVTHAPLRAYVMGERGADPMEVPTAEELAEMAIQVRAGMQAGAIGFTTSRTYIHRTRDGAPLGTRYSGIDELTALAGAMADTGRGVIQLISDAYQSADEDFMRAEMATMRALVEATGRPLSMTVQQPEPLPDRWRQMTAWVDECVAAGLPMKTQVSARPIGVLQGLTATLNPLILCPSFQEVARLPLPELVHALRDPDRRARIVAEHATREIDGMLHEITNGFHKLFPMGDPVDYEPTASTSIAGLASASGRNPVEVVLDLLVERDGNQLLYMPLFNFAKGNLDDVREMLLAPNSLLGLSDAGAHCGAISDASMTTTALALWTRDRRGDRLPVELMVHHLTQRGARHVGWFDRGVVAPGYLADLNVIDMAALGAHPPHIVHDLPAGGRRLMQTATGYRHTFKSGVETFADGEHTGRLPGVLVRGAQPAPA